MKKVVLYILWSFASVSGFSQSKTDTIPKLKLKRGIYFSFAEMLVANPGNIDSFTIKERTEGSIIMVGGGKYTFELASENNAEFRKIRKNMIGISDGEFFYISDKYTIGGWQGLTACILSGPYIIVPIRGSASQYTGGGMVPGFISIGKGFLIDIREGTSHELTNKFIKKLISKYPIVAENYKDKENIVEYSAEIINSINKIESN